MLPSLTPTPVTLSSGGCLALSINGAQQINVVSSLPTPSSTLDPDLFVVLFRGNRCAPEFAFAWSRVGSTDSTFRGGKGTDPQFSIAVVSTSTNTKWTGRNYITAQVSTISVDITPVVIANPVSVTGTATSRVVLPLTSTALTTQVACSGGTVVKAVSGSVTTFSRFDSTATSSSGSLSVYLTIVLLSLMCHPSLC